MSSPSFKLTSLEKLFSILRSELRAVAGERSISVKKAVNSVLSQDIYAKYDNPPFNNSAVDGFAINGNANNNKQFSLLPGLIKPGVDTNISLKAKESIEILTGAPIPHGTKRIIFKENTKKLNQTLSLITDFDDETNVRLKGEDFREGDLLLSKGSKIKLMDLPTLIASGNLTVPTVKPLRVGLLTTGNEIRSASKKKSSGWIFDSNFIPLETLIRAWGHYVIKLGSVNDNLKVLKETIFENLNRVDTIVSTGGVSTGEEDFVSKFLNKEGKVFNWRVAIKPGRPFICGKLKTKYIFGLPGNPVAAFICSIVILRPALGRIGGEKEWFKPLSFKAKANFKKNKKPGRTEFLRARYNQQDGNVTIYPYEGSGRLLSLSWSNGVVELPESSQKIEIGDNINFFPFDSFL